MKLCHVLIAASLVSLGASAAAAEDQGPPAPAVDALEVIGQPGSVGRFGAAAFDDSWRQKVLRLGGTYELKADDAVREMVLITASSTIAGHVDRGVAVIFGKVTLASTASIDGDFVVIGGAATAERGARLAGDLVVVGGQLDAPTEFATGRSQVVIAPWNLGARLEPLVPWLLRGLLWGRLIVPGLPWIWSVVAVFFFVYLVLGFIFERPIGRSTNTLSSRPLTAFLTGLLVLLLAGPVSFLLSASIVGIAIVPILLCALAIAWVVGKVAVARWLGRSVVGEDEGAISAVRSFAIGFAIISIAYMVPLLGLTAWTIFSVLGLGATALTFIGEYRRENPPPVRPETTASTPAARPAPTIPPFPAGDVMPHAPLASAVVPPIPQPVGPSDLALFPRASFRDRILSAGLDLILVVFVWQFLDPLLRRDNSFVLLLLIYHCAFLTWKGTTVGGIICQLRVVRTDGSPLRFADALVRVLSSIFSALVLGLGFLWIVRDPDRQAWHDRIAGTYVVKVPRNFALA